METVTRLWSISQLVPIYQVKKEGILQDFAETSNNPFDQRKSINSLANKSKKTPINFDLCYSNDFLLYHHVSLRAYTFL